jgi:AcrR family transcriptional regulator
VTRAILAAAFEEVGAVGYTGFTFDGVAGRAGVHRTSVYRRWADKNALLTDALLASAETDVPQPDTGSLEGDLRLLLHAVAANLARPATRALLRVAAAESETVPEIGRIAKQFWARRIGLAAELVHRGQRRGEASPDLVAEQVIEGLIAPLFLRLLVTGAPIDTALVDRLVEDTMRGVRGHAGR